MKLELLTSPGCTHCHEVNEYLAEIKPQIPHVDVEEIDILSPRGQEMVQKYMIFSSPGIIIDGELFATGGVDKGKLFERLKQAR